MWFLRFGLKMLSAYQIAGFLNLEQKQWNSMIFCILMESHLSSFKKFCVSSVKNRCSHSGHRTLKLAVSEEQIDGINSYFFCYKFRKAKIYFDNFWVGMVKNGCCHIDHRALKLSVSQELMKWADFVNADNEVIIFCLDR